jgi:hypothetical protein
MFVINYLPCLVARHFFNKASWYKWMQPAIFLYYLYGAETNYLNFM